MSHGSLKLKDLIGPIVAAIAVTVGIWQYRSTSQDEFLKPVREAQLKLYQDASSAAARIATLEPKSPDWIKAQQEFLALYYGPMAIVEDFDHIPQPEAKKLSVEEAMIIFKSCMDDTQQCEDLSTNLTDLSLALAHTCRESLARSWGEDFKELKGDYQTIAIQYRYRLQVIKKGTIDK